MKTFFIKNKPMLFEVLPFLSFLVRAQCQQCYKERSPPQKERKLYSWSAGNTMMSSLFFVTHLCCYVTQHYLQLGDHPPARWLSHPLRHSNCPSLSVVVIQRHPSTPISLLLVAKINTSLPLIQPSEDARTQWIHFILMKMWQTCPQWTWNLLNCVCPALLCQWELQSVLIPAVHYSISILDTESSNVLYIFVGWTWR